MKIKSDFITNSSSASYILHMEDLTKDELLRLYRAKGTIGWNVEIRFGCMPSDEDLEAELIRNLKGIGIEESRGEWED